MKDQFVYENDAPKLDLSQCSECDHNSNFDDCEKYGTKPDLYAYNKEVCPERSS